MIRHGLKEPGLPTIALVFSGGLLTSLGPCSISLLPVTMAYLAGFDNRLSPLLRSLSFCGGIVTALVILGGISGFLGQIYGQVPILLPEAVAILALIMGLNLLGVIQIPLPAGPDPRLWAQKLPPPLAPIAAGLAFGLAASPCTTPVLAVLLGWIAQNGNPMTGLLLLTSFGAGQVVPLLIAGTAAATIPSLLALRPFAQWIPALSGAVLVTTGVLSLLANLV